MTTIGIAIAAYNGAATIDAALASVAAQTRKPDQVVIVDDGSTDDTAQRVRAWADVLPLELVAHGSNRGLSAARTTGTSLLRTDLVLAIDVDDVWLPHHLAVMEHAYEQQRGIVCPVAVEWTPGRSPNVDWTRRLQSPPRKPDLEHLLIMNWIFSGAMYERAAYEAAGGEHRFAGCDDWDLWIRLVAAGRPTVAVDEPTVLYRVHQSNMSADDQLLPREIEVLEVALVEQSGRSVLKAARTGIRHRRGRLALRSAYGAARDGRDWSARRHAFAALLGPWNVRLRGAAMLIAPGRVTERRDALHQPARC